MPGKIIQELLSLLQWKISEAAQVRTVRDQIGLCYTGVQLDTGHIDVFYMPVGERPDCCEITAKAETLAGIPTLEIAALAASKDWSEAVVGVATVNPLFQIELERSTEGYDIVEEAVPSYK